MPQKHYEWEIGQKPPELQAHSLVKHDLYEGYLRTYINRLTRTVFQERLILTIVDGFCGGGIYQSGAKKAHGSPLRALYAVQEAEVELAIARRKGFKIDAHFYFVDDEKLHVDFLRDVLIQHGFEDRLGKTIHLVNSNFATASPEIIGNIKKRSPSQRAIFLLDQYGWSHVGFETLRSIFRDLANPEVILTFAVDFLIDYLCPTSNRIEQALAGIEISSTEVEKLVALRGQVAHRALIQNCLYKHLVGRTGARFYSPFFIHSNSSNKDLWLIHLSQHRQARDEMGKIHWTLGNNLSHHGRDGFQSLGFRPRLDLEQQIFDFTFTQDDWKRSGAVVLEQLPYLLDGLKRPATIEEIFTANCNDTPVVLELVNEQLAVLRDAGELSIKSVEGSMRSRTTDFAWSDVVTMSPQRLLFSVASPRF